MLSKISHWLERHLNPGGDSVTPAFTPAQKQLAMAALLVEIAMADHEFAEEEIAHLLHLLERKFSLPPEEQAALLDLAKSYAKDATSLHEFTRLVNLRCDHPEKLTLVKAMWELAYADGHLDKHEEHMIRRVADLLHLSHSEFMRAKHLAREEMNHVKGKK